MEHYDSTSTIQCPYEPLHKISQPLLSDPTASAPPRIISSVERSRPPVYSPELSALLLSPYARPLGRTTLKPSHLHDPPTLPSRADPSSGDARLFGPLSKRREVNTRWRYFSYQWKRVYPPIEVSVEYRGKQETPSQKDAVVDPPIPGVGMQTAGLLEELKTLAGPVSERPPSPRRIDPIYDTHTRSTTAERPVLPTRYLRRRYRELLGRLPILSYVPGSNSDGHATGKYAVSLAANALPQRIQHKTAHSSEVDAVDLAWFQHGNKNP
jgi:hypothetical protein